MGLKPRLTATAVGSFPHRDPEAALDIILRSLPDAPTWPQLPQLGLNEQMEIQYTEGMPRVVIERDKARMYFDTTGDYSEEFAAFYDDYLTATDADDGTGDFSRAAITEDISRGLHAACRRLERLGKKLPMVKVQTTGPCTFALAVVDEAKRAIFYNEEFRDLITKALAMKCRWQIQKFAPFAKDVICFIDEPILSAFGSSTYISVTRQDVTDLLGEVIEAVRAQGGLAGVHCCGNTDWGLLVEAGADLINFDAYGYGETVSLYPAAIREHIERGGVLAWGLVPTSRAVREATPASLSALFDEHLERLVDTAGIDRRQLLEQSLLTPSCGTGALEVADAERVFGLLAEMVPTLRERHRI